MGRGLAWRGGAHKGAPGRRGPSVSAAPLLDPGTLRAFAALMGPPGAPGGPDELAAAPALAWLAGACRPRRVVRLGTGGGAALAALARAAERLGAGARVLGVPCREGEPGAEARGVAREHGEVLRLAPGGRAAREQAGEVGLLSLGAAAGLPALRAWRERLAPDGVVAIDAPDGEAMARAMDGLGEALGDGVRRAALGGLAVALPGAAPCAGLAAALDDAAVAAPLSAMLGRLGRALRAEARADAPVEAPDLREALRRAEDLADSRLVAATQSQGRALAAMRQAEALREEADRLARRRGEDDASVARAMAERERELHEARRRAAALEAQVERLDRQLAARFEEIALLTRERVGG